MTESSPRRKLAAILAIINVSSCDGMSSSLTYDTSYAVSKGALHMLTRATTLLWTYCCGIKRLTILVIFHENNL